MPSPSRGDTFLSQLSTPGMVLLAAVLFAGLAIAPRYMSVRPSPPAPTVASPRGTCTGLLTQDPLAIVRREGGEAAGVRSELQLAPGLRLVLELGARGEAPAHRATGCEVDGCASCLGEKIRAGSTLVLLESLGSGSMAEDQERRIRARQATLYALLHAGYAPANARTLEYFCLDQEEPPVAFEWFESPDPTAPLVPARVLVLWLREDQDRGRPLEQATDVLARLELDGSPAARVCWIGPTSTFKLKQLLEDERWERGGLPSVDLLSPYATARTELEKRIQERSDPETIRIHPTIGADLGLARLLVAELLERIPDLMPLEQLDEPAHPLVRSVSLLPWGFGPRDRVGAVRVAVLAEADTPYGSAWIRNLESARKTLSKDQGLADLRLEERLQFQLFPLVSLIDGAPLKGEADSLDPDYPIGAKQIDYLRRLEDDLATSESGGGRDYAAIGVFCTDVYDTLMILEALRPHFPQAIFFTTDLDARYLHERHLPFTRNLIIASHYGLTDDASDGPPGRRTVPEFRNSYQTSVFRSVTAALRGRTPPVGAPRLHEIGAGRAVVLDLPLGVGSAPGSLPERSRAAEAARRLVGSSEALVRFLLGRRAHGEQTVLASGGSLALPAPALPEPAGQSNGPYWLALVSVVGLALLFAFLVHRSSLGREITLRRRTLLLVGLLWLASGAWILDRASRPSSFAQEPLVLFGGVSVWPSILLRIAVVLFASVAIVHIQRRMVLVARELRLKHLMIKPARETERRAGAEPAPTRPRAPGKGRRWSSRDIARWLVWSDAEVTLPLENVWMHIERWLASRWLWLRLFLYAIAIYFAASPFYMLSSPPGIPVRGAFAYTLERWTLIASLFAFFMLFAQVLELNFLAVRLIMRITERRAVDLPMMLLRARARPESRPSSELAVRRRFGRTTDRVLRLHLCRDITRAVENLVYLPMVAVCMLVLARASVFDAWSWPPVLVWTFIVFFALLFACVWVLRRTVKEILARDIATIDEERVRLQMRRLDVQTLDRDRGQLLELRGGAFSPLTEHPLVRTSLLPLATFATTLAMNGELLATLRRLF